MNAGDQRELAGLIDRRLIATLGVRPADTPGWGRLTALKSTKLRSPDGELVEFKAGITNVCSDYWAVRLHPELFRACDRRDTRTLREHARSLERVRQELERGTPTRTATRTGVLPPREGDATLRLPRSPSARPLRLPQ